MASFQETHNRELFSAARSALRLGSIAIALVYLVLAILHPLVLPAWFAWWMTPIASVTTLVCVAIYYLLKSGKINTFRSLYALQCIMLVCVCTNVFAHLYLSGDVIHSTNLLLVLFVMAILIFNPVTFYTSLAVITIIWAVIFFSLPRAEGETLHYVYTVAMTIFLASTVFVGRSRDLNDKVRELAQRENAEEELKALNLSLEELSNLDPLTGIGNRRYFNSVYHDIFKASVSNATPIAFLICDIDNFKDFNDTHGHEAGDRALKELATILKTSVGEAQHPVFRFGGEEFVLICPGLEEAAATQLSKNIRTKTHELEIESSNLTVSIGVCCAVPDPGMDSNELYIIADEALYEAKRRGKDCFVVNSISNQLAKK